ncbi:hypothetical protein CH253_22860 [Rhodococcus sp. 06-156-3C]|nr:hypothetical protein CH248_28980 [Rhodococcus sp. 06-156-4a]OZD15804.1 hypothetical protein CH253_22860 [Rhodococcus sp. 06-156-3C]OZD21187.1 hypothetical protein CH280_03090 [Rhodococcus sp. 06-156-4C]OZD32370.1 hypothetical protein CH284_21025 [Rhodococcus sp. 06-156-3]OZD36592.1 hypothetical protein CH247_03445 [Rhodococcus sp. 06-156-3b]OZF59311.1 hypothetical protein CH290_21915 [Rhodococcus sp. 06-156-4]
MTTRGSTMSVATLAELDEVTIGPHQLRSFIEALDRFRDLLTESQSSKIARVTTDLRVALGKWHKSICANTGGESIDRLPYRNDDDLPEIVDCETYSRIELHLSRLITRHSNFGFAAANDPSELDRFFPDAALADIRTARAHLRRVLSELKTEMPRQHPRSVTVTDRYMSIVLW